MARALKVLVIVLGILLIGGVVALVAMIVARSGTTLPRPAAAPPRGVPYEAAVDRPPGARIVDTQAEGPHLVVTIALPDGRQQILLLDLASGARLGTIELRGAK
jgi:hypothetical protein